MADTFYRPMRRASPTETTGMAGDQPGAVPIMSGDPTRDELPIDENGDPVPMLFMSDGTGTGESGDLILATPNDADGVDAVVAVDLSASITLGVDSTGLL